MQSIKTVRDVCKFIANFVGHKPLCLETGCTYTCAEGNEIHTTTNNIWEYVCAPRGGLLWSFDIDDEHIKFATSMLDPEANVNFVHGDSVRCMKDLVSQGDIKGPVNVLCLDSKEFDEDHMVNEYNAVKGILADKHFVLVDDIHNPNSVKYKKMVPVLRGLGYFESEIPTPTGMLLASKGFSSPIK